MAKGKTPKGFSGVSPRLAKQLGWTAAKSLRELDERLLEAWRTANDDSNVAERTLNALKTAVRLAERALKTAEAREAELHATIQDVRRAVGPE